MAADGAGSAAALAVAAAFAALLASAGLALLAGGIAAGISAAAGALCGAGVQSGAAILLLRRRPPGMLWSLGAPALSSLVRVVGGAVVVTATLALGVPAPLAFLAGFGALYVVLEVVTDLLVVKRENRSNRPG